MEIGAVSAKRQRTAAPAGSRAATAPLGSTVHPAGAVSRQRKRAFRSGWSKQGNSRLASEGTSNV